MCSVEGVAPGLDAEFAGGIVSLLHPSPWNWASLQHVWVPHFSYYKHTQTHTYSHTAVEGQELFAPRQSASLDGLR